MATKEPCLLFLAPPLPVPSPREAVRWAEGEPRAPPPQRFRFNAVDAHPGQLRPGSLAYSELLTGDAKRLLWVGYTQTWFSKAPPGTPVFHGKKFKSGRCCAHGEQVSRFSGNFLEVGARRGVWLRFWE